MVSSAAELVKALPKPSFDWQRDYAPLWEGRNEGHLNDILFGPGPDDVVIINGVRARFADHQSGRARETAKYMPMPNDMMNAYQQNSLFGRGNRQAVPKDIIEALYGFGRIV